MYAEWGRNGGVVAASVNIEHTTIIPVANSQYQYEVSRWVVVVDRLLKNICKTPKLSTWLRTYV